MYHVIQRGNNREPVFVLPEYKAYLLEQLQNAANMGGLDIFAYVIMDNHFHLAVRTNKEPLSKIMHHLNSRFSRYYNREQGRTGHVFESRYRAVLIENEKYLLTVVRYIHRNPIRAGLCATAADYEWSSDADYRQRRSEGSRIVCTKPLLEILDDDPERAFKKYVFLMEQDDDGEESCEDISLAARKPLPPKVEREQAGPARKPLDEILLSLGLKPDEFVQVKSGSRKRSLVPYKVRYVREALAQGYTLQEIGENIRISSAAVCKLLSGARHLTY